MLRDEALVFRTKFEHELKESVNNLLAHIHQRTTINTTTNNNITNAKHPSLSLYIKKADALVEYNGLYTNIMAKYERILYESMGGKENGGSLVETIVTEFLSFTKLVSIDVLQKFTALYQQQFNEWLQRTRQVAENNIDSDMKAIELKLPLAEYHTKTDVATSTATTAAAVVETLSDMLEAVYARNIASIGGVAYYGSDCKEVVDAENIISRYFNMLANNLKEKNANMLVEVQKRVAKHYNEALKSIDRYLDETFIRLNENVGTGYTRVSLEEILNKQSLQIKAKLLGHIKLLPDCQSILDSYDNYCFETLQVKMSIRYKEIRDVALLDAIKAVDADVQKILQHYDLNQIWTENIITNEQKIDTLMMSLNQLYNNMQARALNAIISMSL